MSQHCFDTLHDGKKTRIVMGWDRPLQGFFMYIEKEDDEDVPYWSNLDWEDSHPRTLQPFIEALKALNISVPNKLLAAVVADGENNAGNRDVFYS